MRYMPKHAGKWVGTPAVGSGSFSDTLMFITTLTGGVTPSLQINPVGKQWGLATGTNFGLTVTRTDHHNLQVGLSLVKPGESTTEVAIVSNTPRASVLGDEREAGAICLAEAYRDQGRAAGS
jgi:hypothetical protein